MEPFESWNRRVLVVDDQEEIHDDFDEILTSESIDPAIKALGGAFRSRPDDNPLPSFDLSHAMDGAGAHDMIKAAREADDPFALAYIDVRMPPGMDGIETIRRIREFEPALEIVIMTAYSDKPLPEIVHDMAMLHKLLYIRKPFAREEIQQITRALVDKWNIEQRLVERERQLIAGHQRLEAVLNATGDAMCMFDGSGRLLVANCWYEALCQATESELRDMSPEDLKTRLEGRLREVDLPGWFPQAAGGSERTIVEEVIAGSGSNPRLFHRSTAAVQDARQAPMGNLVVYRDVSREFEARHLRREVLRLRSELDTTYTFEGMVGVGRNMQQVYTLMQRAAESDLTVLIEGESGTGKELVAKSIHYNGDRKTGPFVAVNCAAVPETLVESELFGHERGAFTGASKQRAGQFERAHGGTIFLDEIGDLSGTLQGKLLRVLEEREILRVGGTADIPVDIRVIAATNKDLEGAVKAGAFRGDLFYRLAAFRLTLPPLRERLEDLPLLAAHFLKRYAERIGKSIDGMSPAALQGLLAHDWPGNVRELKNAIEYGVLLETTDRLQAGSLPSQIATPEPAGHGPGGAVARPVLSLAEIERQALVQAVEAAHKNTAEAAQMLGVSRATLYRKLRKYELLAG